MTQLDAERLKERYGAGFEPLVPESDVFELPSTPGQGARNAQRRVLAHIMHMRLQEVLEYALDEITRAGYHQRLARGRDPHRRRGADPGHRGAGARGVRHAGPVRRSRASGSRGLADSVESPRMAVPAGLVLYGARQVAMSGGFGTGCPEVAGGGEGACSGETVAPGLLLSRAEGTYHDL